MQNNNSIFLIKNHTWYINSGHMRNNTSQVHNTKHITQGPAHAQ